MKTPETDFMSLALAQARQAAELKEVPVGAVIVLNEKVIASAHNQKESNKDATAHAEVLAIQKAENVLGAWRLLECELYVTLEPCLMCLAASQQARVKKIIYGAKDAKGGAHSLGYRFNEDLRLNHRFEVVHEENIECEKVLKEFFSERRKKK